MLLYMLYDNTIDKENFQFLKASGAYIFRPNVTYPIKSQRKVILLLKHVD